MSVTITPPKIPVTGAVKQEFLTKHHHAYRVVAIKPIHGLRVPAFEVDVSGSGGTARIITVLRADTRLKKKVGGAVVIKAVVKAEGDPTAVNDIIAHIEDSLKLLHVEHRKIGPNAIDIPRFAVFTDYGNAREVEAFLSRVIMRTANAFVRKVLFRA